MDRITAENMVYFWHQHIDQPQLPPAQRYRSWFNADAELAQQISSRYGRLVEQLSASAELNPGPSTIQKLASIIALDHFPRTLFRKEPRAYQGHARAAVLARELIESGQAESLPLIERIVLAICLSNTEDMALHEEALANLNKLAASVPPGERKLVEGFNELAVRRKEILRQHRRFPVRNQALGRASTPGEAYFVAASGWEYE